jgi:hypothetical protein
MKLQDDDERPKKQQRQERRYALTILPIEATYTVATTDTVVA